MKKKICMLIYDLRIGGAENMICQISNGLSNDFDITILTLSNVNKYKDTLNSNIKYKNLNILKISKAIFKLYQFLKKNEFDIIVSNVWPITIISSIISIFIKKTKLILVEHSVLVDQFYLNSNFATKFLKYISVFIFYNLSDRIIAVSNVAKLSLIKIGVRKSKISVIHNFVNINLKPKKGNFYSKFGYNNKILKLLNIGIFKEIKNQIFLIEVANILLKKYKIDFILLIVGNGPLENKLQNKINFYKLNNHVKIINSNNYVTDTINECDIFLSSSKSESFGLSILEALCCNKKVVVSDIEISKELIDKKHYEFICDLNSDLFAKKIIYLSSKKMKDLDEFYKNKFDMFDAIKNYKKEIYKIL